MANPTYGGTGSTAVQHTEHVRGLWAFRPDLLTLATALPRAAGGTAAGKEAKAIALHGNLRMSDPTVVHDGRVVVYDDVCTTGSQLNAVARFLREHGAASVEGLVLARAPWR